MATPIVMPQLGESVSEGTVGRWLKSAGDRVEKDESLLEIITDKVNAEIPSPVAGIVVALLVAEGQTVPVGTVIATINEGIGASTSGGWSAPEQRSNTQETGSGSAARPASQTNGGSVAVIAEPTRTSPLVRRLARERGLDLSLVRGTGAGERVTRDDLLRFEASRSATPDGGASTLPATIMSNLIAWQ